MLRRVIVLGLITLLMTSCGLLDSRENEEPGYQVGAMIASEDQDGGASDPRSPLYVSPSDPNDLSEPLREIPHRRVIFHNGVVLTMNDAQPVTEAIAIEGNTILAIGSLDEVLAYRLDDTVMIDLAGRTLMPGFVDGHSHMFTGYEGLGGSILAVQEQVLAEGITTMADMGGGRGEIITELQNLEASGDLRMRVSMYLNQISTCGEDFGYWYADFPQSIESGVLVHIPGVKIFLDGGSCNKIARSVGDPGDLYFTLEETTQIIEEIDARGYQVAVHALGDRAVEQVLAAMNTVIGDGPNDMRHRIEHNASVRPGLIPLYSESKPVAMIFGGSAACWWSGTSDRWETAEGEYLAWEWPSRALIEANPDVVFAWHEDVPIFPLGAVEQLWGFVTRKQIAEDGSICEPPEFALAGAIPVETALKAMTINAAYALFRDDDIGSLEPGKFADMIILSDNPLMMNPDDLINLEVLLTMVNGRVEYCAAGMEAMCP